MLIGKRKQKIVIIVGVIIMAFIIYRIYQKNRTIEVYPIYCLEYAVKNFHFGKNQFKQLDTIAKRILIDSLPTIHLKKNYSTITLSFINGEYFTLTPEYKGLDFTIDWYDAATFNIIAFYRWNLATGKNINKEYYKEDWLWANQIDLSITDTTLDVDKSLLPYYIKK